MTAPMLDLARRAVACEGFRWMPGMLAVRVRSPVFFSEGVDPSHLVGRSYRVTEIRESTVHCAGEAFLTTLLNFAPDLTDPATLGCLLALVREAWKSPVAQISPSLPDGHIWTCYINDEANDRLFRERTEAEALVAALEAAADRSGDAP